MNNDKIAIFNKAAEVSAHSVETPTIIAGRSSAIIAMSGGVDSSVAAVLSLENGLRCAGITLKLFNGDNKSLSGAGDAEKIAKFLGIEHIVLDFSEEFDLKVIRHFIRTYEEGATPNPCIECNRNIKFNMHLLRGHLKKTNMLEFDFLITGHYAKVLKDEANGRFLLQKAVDIKKDQSYVLYSLTQEQLKTARFPLGELTKEQVRKIAGDRRLLNAKKEESQDICFVPDGNYGSFIENYTGKTYPCGDIIDMDGKVIGRHKGLYRYTIGQRRGLGVAANIPVYVAAKSLRDNTVTLGPDEALFKKSLTAKDINLIACTELKRPMRVMVKTRYLQEEQPAIAEQIGENTLHVEFDNPQRAITPGQAAVMYDGDIVIGGGTIC